MKLGSCNLQVDAPPLIACNPTPRIRAACLGLNAMPSISAVVGSSSSLFQTARGKELGSLPKLNRCVVVLVTG